MIRLTKYETIQSVPFSYPTRMQGFSDSSVSVSHPACLEAWTFPERSSKPRTCWPIVSSTATVVFTTSRRIFMSFSLAFWKTCLQDKNESILWSFPDFQVGFILYTHSQPKKIFNWNNKIKISFLRLDPISYKY